MFDVYFIKNKKRSSLNEEGMFHRLQFSFAFSTQNLVTFAKLSLFCLIFLNNSLWSFAKVTRSCVLNAYENCSRFLCYMLYKEKENYCQTENIYWERSKSRGTQFENHWIKRWHIKRSFQKSKKINYFKLRFFSFLRLQNWFKFNFFVSDSKKCWH